MNETDKREMYIAAHIVDEKAKDDLFMVQNKTANIIAGRTTPEQVARIMAEKDGAEMVRLVGEIDGNPLHYMQGICVHQLFSFVAVKHASNNVADDVSDEWAHDAEKAFWEEVQAST